MTSTRKSSKNNNKKPARASLGANMVVPPLEGGIAFAATALFCFMPLGQALAQTVNPADTNTQVYNAPNGVPIVDIAQANAQGLSHNRFLSFDVSNRGVVLNNNNRDEIDKLSQLAGKVQANLNLTNEASVILNEVTAAKRSELNGFMEVLGQSADVIIANPYGITCSGCGFINTPNATLTTGAPQIAGGVVTGYQIRNGDIVVEGTGLDANAPNYLLLAGRNVRLDGQVNAKQLDVVAGSNDFDVNSKAVTEVAATGAAPSFAIDSTAVGGMYANRIRLIATENGVGVRLLGDVAALGDDVTLTADGRITVGGKVSAERDIAVTTSSNNAQALTTTNGSFAAKRDIAFAVTGGVDLTGGSIVAQRDLTLSAQSFADAKSNASLTDNNRRHAVRNLSLTIVANATVSGTIYSAGDTLTGNVGNFSVGADGATLFAENALALTSGNTLALNTAKLISNNATLTLTSVGALTTAAGAEMQADIIEILSNGFTNAGAMSTDVGNIRLRVDGEANNSGNISAFNDLRTIARTDEGVLNFTNSGTLFARNLLRMRGQAHVNSGAMQGSAGAELVGTSFNNSGQFYAGADAGTDGSLFLNSLTNSGLLQTARNLVLTVRNTLANNGGSILAGNGLLVEGRTQGSLLAYTATGANSVLQAGGALTLRGHANSVGQFSFDAQAGKTIASALTVNATSFANAGILQTDNDSTLNLTAALTNSGTMLALRDFTVNSSSTINNQGSWQTTRSFLLSGSVLTNSGTILKTDNSAGNTTLTFASLNNSGTLQSATNLSLGLTTRFDNSGKTLASNDVTVTGAGALDIYNTGANAVLQAGNTLNIGSARTVEQTLGLIFAQRLDLSAVDFSNSGTVQTEGLANATLTNNFGNTGTWLTKDVLTLAATNALTNSGGMQANNGATITAGSVNNSGTLIGSNNVANDFVLNSNSITNSGTLQSARDTALNVLNTINNSGNILARDITVRGRNVATTLTFNNSAGVLQSSRNLNMAGFGGNALYVLNISGGTVLANNNLTVNGASLTNSGLLQADVSGTITLTGALTNNGTWLTSDALSLTADSVTNALAAQWQATKGLLLTTTSFTNNGLLIGSANSGFDASISADTFSNSGTVQSARDLTLMVRNTLTNAGQILADDDIAIAGRNNGSTLTVNNSSTNSVIQAADALTMTGFNGNTDLAVTHNGGKVLANSFTLVGSSFSSASGTVVQTEDNSTVSLTGDFTNRGTWLTKNILSLTAANILNEGALQSTRGLLLTGTSLTNSGNFIASNTVGQSGTFNVNSFTNSGLVQSAEDLNLNVRDTLTNSGRVLATDDITVRGRNSGTTLSLVQNDSASVFQAGDALDMAGNAGDGLFNLTINNGRVQAQTLTLNGIAVTNAGRLQTGGAASVTLTGAFANNAAGTILVQGAQTLTAATTTNAGAWEAMNGLTLISSSLNNSGNLLAASATTADAAFTLNTLTNSGTLQSNRDLTLTLNTSLTNSLNLIAGRDLRIALSNSSSSLAVSNSSAGRIQATGAVIMQGHVFGTVAVNTQAGIILGGSLNLSLSNINNTGTVQAENAATFNIGTVINSGTVLVKDVLTANIGTLTNNSNWQATNGGTLTGAIFTNTGTYIAASASTRNGSVVANILANSGTLQSGRDLTLTVNNTLTNTNKIIAERNLDIAARSSGELTINNNAGSTLQGTTGRVQLRGFGGNTNVVLNNSNNILANLIDFSINNLTNSGLIQGATGNNYITAVSTLTNNSGGKIILGTTGSQSGTLESDSITNSGTLQSAVGLNLYSRGLTNNAGAQIISSGQLSSVGLSTSSYTINNNGLIQAGTGLNLTGAGGTNAVVINGSNAASVFLGGTVQIRTTALTLANNATLSSTGNMLLATNSLSMGGSGTAIVAATSGTGTATITLATTGLTNPGAIHSGQNLTLSALSINNTGTGGISAINTLNVSATSGNFDNYGALYAGLTLNASSTGTFFNRSTGTIDGGRDISITAPTVRNNNDIVAQRNISITATNFHNEVVGGDNRVWNYVGTGFDDTPGSNRTGADRDANPRVAGWSATETGVEEVGGFGDYEYRHDWEATFFTAQLYSGGKPTNIPQIIGGGTLSILNFTTATNVGGVISSPTVNISTTTGGATFTNNDMSLTRKNWKATWNDLEDCGFLSIGPCDFTNYRDYNKFITSTTTIDNVGAGIFATTLNASGFSLSNAGSPNTAAPGSRSASGASASGLQSGGSNTSGAGGVSGVIATAGLTGLSADNAANGVGPVDDTAGASGASTIAGGTGATGASGLSGTSSASGANAVSGTSATAPAPKLNFNGVIITLPTNPNGLFVTNRDPNARFLIESNPRFMLGTDFGGSDYLAKRLGYNPDTITRRLGDSNYEGYLIRQQLVSQVGTNLLNNAESEAKQMQRLMDNSVTESSRLGLQFGRALTPSQIANLKQDVVWMVETTVQGVKVLAPVVYLAATTKEQIKKGAIISASNANLDLTKLDNVGGTIEGSNNLKIKTAGDITNVSGTIKGGNVDLAAGGSIVNKTLASTTGNDANMATVIGKEASITSTGNLKMDAKKDITNLGAQVSAGGNADLKAGGNLTFDTIEDKSAKTTKTGLSIGFLGSNTTTVEKETKQIKSGLTVGGNLKSQSGGDTTFAGTDVNVKGNANIKSDGSLNIIAREDSKEKTTTTKTQGMFGSGSSTEKGTKTTTNVGSNFNVGGNLKTDSAKDTTIQGSDVNVGGNADLKTGGDLNILAGKNTRTDTSKTSQTGLGVGGPGSLYGSETTENTKFKQDSVGSNLKVGGNLKAKSANDITVQGSNVDAKGNVALDAARDLNVLAAQNVETETTKKTTTAVGLWVENEGKAGADASATAKGRAGVLGATGRAEAQAGAKAEGETRLTLAKSKTETQTDKTITNTGSSIKSGGDLNMKAGRDIDVMGSDIEAGGDANIDAKRNQTFREANDSKETIKSSEETKSGLYISGEAKASAKAGARGGASPIGVVGGKAEASAGADAEAGVGLYAQNTKEGSTDGSSTARTSTIKAGGNVTRKAGEKLTDVGTQIDAGGDYSQEAKEIENKAAADREWSSENSESHTGKLGVYATAGVGGEASSTTGTAKARANVEGGVKAQYEMEKSSSSDQSSKAVTGTIKAGGNIKSKSEGKTTFEGTNIDAGKNVDLEAGSLDFKAAADTTKTRSDNLNVNAELKVGVSKGTSGSGPTGSIGGGFDAGQSGTDSSTAVVGSIKSGGNLNVKTKDNARFEGAQLEAGGSANIESEKGNVTFDAARNTESDFDKSQNFKAELSASKSKGEKSGGISAEGGMTDGASNKSTAVVSNIKTGAGTNIKAKNDVTMEGTNIDAGGDVGIGAGGNVNMKAARNTEESHEGGFQAGISGSATRGKNDKGGDASRDRGALSFEGSYDTAKSDKAQVGNIKSGGNLKVDAGKDINVEGTKMAADGTAELDADGKVNVKAAKSTSSSFGIEGSLDIAGDNKKSDDGKKTSGGVPGMTLGGDVDSSSSEQAASITGGEGAKVGNAPVAFAPAADGSFKASVQIPQNLPAGTKVEAKTASGAPLPSWLKFDPATGSFSGKPPADFKGSVNVVVNIPGANGQSKQVQMKFGQ